MTTQHVYDQVFYDQMERGARSSARQTLGFLKQFFVINSVLDVGAGRGGWLAEWLASGIQDITGVDGSYVRREELLIPQSAFVAHDLKMPLNLGRQFDLVESLEVAEHIARERADTFVETLVSHGRLILFSAATPGQGGEFHVNEQPLDYWREKFLRHGYHAYDPLRAQFRDNADVEPWYRYNMLLYMHDSLKADLPSAIVRTRVEAPKVDDYRPAGYRFKAFFASFLPVSISTQWAMFKDRARIYLRR